MSPFVESENSKFLKQFEKAWAMDPTGELFNNHVESKLKSKFFPPVLKPVKIERFDLPMADTSILTN